MHLFEEKNETHIKQDANKVLTNIQKVVQLALFVDLWDSFKIKLFKPLEFNMTIKLVVLSEFQVARVLRPILKAERGYEGHNHQLQ